MPASFAQITDRLRTHFAGMRGTVVASWKSGDRHPPTVMNFLRAAWGLWGAKMSGVFSVPFGALAVWSDSSKGTLIWSLLAVSSLLLAAYLVWAVERQKVNELEAAALPALKFEFDPKLATHSYFFQQMDHQDVLITVRNLSTISTIDGVRVVLEWVSLGERTRTQPKEDVLQLQFEAGDSVSIAPTGQAHFRLCTILQEGGPPPAIDVPPLGIVFAPRDGRLREKPALKLGSYEAHVRLEGRHVRPQRGVYRVTASAVSGSLGFRAEEDGDGHW